jgi:DNA-binding CsgD family transcriptional regulator
VADLLILDLASLAEMEHHIQDIQDIDVFSSITAESFYVLDTQRKQFCYIKPDDLFLCGFPVEDALRLGYDFYSKIIYPEDLPLWYDMSKVVWRYLKDNEEKRNAIDYFSCTFRLQHRYSFLAHPLLQMVYQRMKPVWETDKLYYLICSVRSSAIKKAGNLCLYNKDGVYGEYNFTSKRWKRKMIEPLTERERAILMLAGQGKSSKEVANVLFKGQNTIRNQIKVIFSKLKVHSMQEAIELAGDHRLVYPKSYCNDRKY